MKKQLLKYLFVLMLIVQSTILFAGNQDKANNNREQILTQEKQAIQVTARQPDFVIKLKSNPTTGYSWFLREYDPGLIVPMGHQFEKPTDNKLVGAPGYEVWMFRVKPAAFIVPHQMIVRMIYARPWESSSDDATDQVFRVTTQAK